MVDDVEMDVVVVQRMIMDCCDAWPPNVFAWWDLELEGLDGNSFVLDSVSLLHLLQQQHPFPTLLTWKDD
jgi:hypothetical protein